MSLKIPLFFLTNVLAYKSDLHFYLTKKLPSVLIGHFIELYSKQCKIRAKNDDSQV